MIFYDFLKMFYDFPFINRFAHSAGPGMEKHVGIDARGCTPSMASEVPLAGKSALRKRLRVGNVAHPAPLDGQLSKKSHLKQLNSGSATPLGRWPGEFFMSKKPSLLLTPKKTTWATGVLGGGPR